VVLAWLKYSSVASVVGSVTVLVLYVPLGNAQAVLVKALAGESVPEQLVIVPLL
jgi:hypothetical protein